MRPTLVVATLLAASSSHGACDGGAAPPAACEPAPEGRLVSFIDHHAWALADPGADPWAEFRPADDISCPPEARKTEDFAGILSFGVETPDCQYTTVSQPITSAVCEGEQLYVWMWRFALTGPPGSSANIGVQLGEDRIYEIEIPIPATSALTAMPVPLPGPYPAGTPIHFHVRNHGDNAYQLLDLARCRGECAPE